MAGTDPYLNCSTEGASGIKSGDYIRQNDLILLRQQLIKLFEKRDNPANNKAGSLKKKKLKEITDETFDFNNDGQQDTKYQNAQNEYITFNHGKNSIQHCLIINDYQELKNQSSQDLILKNGVSNDTGLIGWITDLIDTKLTSDNSGCRGACTGICIGTCYSGCGDTCGSQCSEKCGSGCSKNCSTNCGAHLAGDQNGSHCNVCTGGCSYGCSGTCNDACGFETSTVCGGCNSVCSRSCASVASSDTSVCYCSGLCSGSCAWTCYENCTTACINTSIAGCKQQCSGGCASSCTNTCIDLCTNTCSTGCSTGCYNSAKT